MDEDRVYQFRVRWRLESHVTLACDDPEIVFLDPITQRVAVMRPGVPRGRGDGRAFS